jgi:cytochrome oxidase Cu insertion factor (SCO1/SenC/PrrC family)
MRSQSRFFIHLRVTMGVLGLFMAHHYQAKAAPPVGTAPAEEGWRMMRRGFAEQFADVTLTSQHGDKVQFFADLVKDRAVVVNFFYTSCDKTCPDTFAKLSRLRREMQPVFGRSLRFISISVDPERDTPAVISRYSRMVVAESEHPDTPDWLMLTGSVEDVTNIRRQFGLVDPDPVKDRDPSRHGSMLAVGNDGTGRWSYVNASLDAELIAMRIKRMAGWTHDMRYGNIQKDYLALIPEMKPPTQSSDEAAPVTSPRSLPVLSKIDGKFLAVERTGQPVRFAELRGKVSVFGHLYTVCPHGSKAVLETMTALQKEFGSRQDFHQVNFASASTRETPAFFKSYAENISVNDASPWWFTTLDQPVLEKFVTSELGLEAPKPIPAEERLNPFDVYENDLRLVLVDQEGRVRGRYQVFHADPTSSQTAAKTLQEDIRTLLNLSATAPTTLKPTTSLP